MGILDGIVEWIAEQVMAGLDLVTTSVLGALGCDMRIKHKYFDEAVPYIDAAVKQTKRLKQISDAAFQRQDIDEIESLALALRKEIDAALQPFYMGHMCLYVTPECFDDPPKTPEVYNDATACVWRDGTWQLLEDTSKGFLLFVQSKSKEEAAA